MALFKFRKGGDEPRAQAAAPTESIEALRRRARHRLIGAAVLVLAGVIGFPLLFDTQPRPVAVDIPIEIPDRNKVRPLAPPAPIATGAVTPASQPEEIVESGPAPQAAAAAAPEPVARAPEAAPAPPPPRSEKPAAEAKPAPAETKPEPATPPKVRADDGARAQALLEGKSEPKADAGRFVVQVGAYAEEARAREARQKLERAGLKTYVHVAETAAGKRTRVRVGPFTSRAEAERAAEKIKGLDLPAAILSL